MILLNINKLIDNLVYFLFVISLVWITFFYHLVNLSYVDEIVVLFLFILFLWKSILIDRIIGKDVIVLICVFLFYLFYSFSLKITSTSAILLDFQQEIKPYLTFYAVYYLCPKFSEKQFFYLKSTVFILYILVLASVFLGFYRLLFPHPTYLANACLVLALTYMYCLKRLSVKNIILILAILSIGLVSARSKFYGEYVLILGILFFYKRKFKFNFRWLLVSLILVSFALYFSWEKITYYFIEGEGVEPRAVLFATSILIYFDYMPFGSGFATFGNEAARVFYSPLYHEYGINNVWGLSEEFNLYATDVFFPILCQFGFLGLFLFFIFWKKVFYLVVNVYDKERSHIFQTGLIIVGIIFIESFADSTLLSHRGVVYMFLLGMICRSNTLRDKEDPQNIQN